MAASKGHRQTEPCDGWFQPLSLPFLQVAFRLEFEFSKSVFLNYLEIQLSSGRSGLPHSLPLPPATKFCPRPSLGAQARHKQNVSLEAMPSLSGNVRAQLEPCSLEGRGGLCICPRGLLAGSSHQQSQVCGGAHQ